MKIIKWSTSKRLLAVMSKSPHTTLMGTTVIVPRRDKMKYKLGLKNQVFDEICVYADDSYDFAEFDFNYAYFKNVKIDLRELHQSNFALDCLYIRNLVTDNFIKILCLALPQRIVFFNSMCPVEQISFNVTGDGSQRKVLKALKKDSHIIGINSSNYKASTVDHLVRDQMMIFTTKEENPWLDEDEYKTMPEEILLIVSTDKKEGFNPKKSMITFP